MQQIGEQSQGTFSPPAAGVAHGMGAASVHPGIWGAEKALSGLSACPCRGRGGAGRWLQQMASLTLGCSEGLVGRAASLLCWSSSV